MTGDGDYCSLSPMRGKKIGFRRPGKGSGRFAENAKLHCRRQGLFRVAPGGGDRPDLSREVIQHAGPVLVDCWAPWCGPCRTVRPIMEQLAGEYAGRVKIAKLNTDQNQRSRRAISNSEHPDAPFFKGGQLVNRQVGALPNEIERLLRALL